MRKKLKDIATLIAGELLGDGEREIRGVSSIEDAKEGDLIFAFDKEALKKADSSSASAIVGVKGSKPKKPAILVSDPRLAMAKILSTFFEERKPPSGIHKTAVIAKDAKIGHDVSIQAFAYIGKGATIGNRVTIYPSVYIGDGVWVGDDTVIYPNAVIYEKVKIGKRVRIHAGAVLGMDGYGFISEEGKYVKIPQVGNVIVEDDVEIYSNDCIARGTLGATVIGRGTKIDNLTHIAHNCKIGENCALTSLIGFAGSTTIEDHVSVGGQAGFAGHITVGKNTVVIARSGVTKNIPPDSVISGFPAVPHKKDLEIQALLRRLPELFKKVSQIEKKLK